MRYLLAALILSFGAASFAAPNFSRTLDRLDLVSQSGHATLRAQAASGEFAKLDDVLAAADATITWSNGHGTRTYRCHSFSYHQRETFAVCDAKRASYTFDLQNAAVRTYPRR